MLLTIVAIATRNSGKLSAPIAATRRTPNLSVSRPATGRQNMISICTVPSLAHRDRLQPKISIR